MDVGINAERRIYLVGDNDESLARFQLTLSKEWRVTATRLNRSQFWGDLTDQDVIEGKFVFVMPFSPRQIIYDETHPSRSFHREIDRADSGNDSGGAVIL